jgi:ParB family chromosome partitioning protein
MATRKAALGRGLNALLPSPAREETTADELSNVETPKSRLYHFEERLRLLGRVAEIDIDHIRPNPYQPRKDFDEQALEELAQSIAQLGIIQPITVRALGNNQFEVISGERRLRAARRAGLKRIPAYIREAGTEEMLEMALVENVQREELNPIEVALGYQRLMEECGLTQEQVAEKVGKNRATIANFLRLLKLPPRIQASLRDGTITAGHARALIGLPESVQLRLLQEIESKQLSVREVEDRVRAWHRAQEKRIAAETTSASAEPDAQTLQLRTYEDQLRRRLGTRVHIRYRTSGRGGRIEIVYFSEEELERLLTLLLNE